MARSKAIGGGRVVLSLTEREAAALDYAAGEALSFPDIAESVFADGQTRAAAYRAWDALRAARATTYNERREQ